MKKERFLIIFLLLGFCSFTPPGTTKVKQGFYMDKGEVAVMDWQEYVYFLKKNAHYNSPEEINAALPDSAIFYATYHVNFDRLSPKCMYYPIIGITYEQATAYCKWRSEVVSAKCHKKVEYRLPTEDEWLALASKSNSQGTTLGTSTDSLQAYTNERYRKGMLHLTDNVSEMTLEKGVAFGNNYTDKTKGLEKHIYAKPEKWLGFRCACEVSK